MDATQETKRGHVNGVLPTPQLTKAQRRELQKTARASAIVSTSTLPSKPKKQQSILQPSKSSTVVGVSTTKDVHSVTSNDADSVLRNLRIFSHFAPPSKPVNSKTEIHPAVLRLASQFAEFRIVGANARCIATVNVLKAVIQDYVTPPQTSLPRHIMTHISPQITHLVSARPMSTSTGSAIRHLKSYITDLSERNEELPEKDAKNQLCDFLDMFVKERIVFANQIIRDTAAKKIQEGDVIMTFGKSSVVEKILLYASELRERKFEVMIVDSGPLFEGKRLLASLTDRGVPCTYCLITALDTAMACANLVLLGTHALHANGALYARAGTAMVAMMAKERSVPVLACCETYKFTNSVPFDGFTKNELGKPMSTTLESNGFLQELNPLYDLTPANYLTAVVTELGLIPPSSVPTVLARAGWQEL